jgi:hypothetical protein
MMNPSDGRPDPAAASPVLAALALVGFFSSVVSISTAGFVLLARSGLGSPLWLAVGCPSLLAAAAFAPFSLPVRWRQRLLPFPFVFPLCSLTVLVSPIAVFVTGPTLALIYPVLAARAVGGALPYLAAHRTSDVLSLAGGAVMFAFYLLVQVHGHAFAHVLAPEYAFLDRLSLDSLYHMAIAHIIQNFGRASTALDGLVPIHYHVGSHYWFAAVATLARTTPLFAYPFGQMIVAIPALYLGLLSATVTLLRPGANASVAIVLAIGIAVFFDFIGWSSYYHSESYTAGLVVALFAVPTLCDLVAVPARTPWIDRGRLAGLLTVIFVAALTKLSVGTVLGAGVGYLVLRLYARSWRSFTVSVALCALGAYAVVHERPPSNLPLREMFSPLHFFRNPLQFYSPRGPYVTFLLPLVFLVGSWWRLRSPRPSAIDRPGTRVTVARTMELVAVMTIVAALPGLTLVLWGGTAWWFANVPQWLVLPMLVSTLSVPAAPSLIARAIPLCGAGALAAILAHAAWTFLPERIAAFARPIVQISQKAKRAPRDLMPEAEIWSRIRSTIADRGTVFDPAVREAFHRTIVGHVADMVGSAAAAGDRGREMMVFVPPASWRFWFGPRFDCVARPLLIPALMGVPMVKGLSPRCAPWKKFGMPAYGYADYGPVSQSTALTEAELCGAARARGFKVVLVLHSVWPRKEAQRLDCEQVDGSDPAAIETREPNAS